ncbi:MAG: hypothetical protein KDD03_02605 [Gelidibacter sp.]|nr:hypothetical protein [Gelidibacter sp.]
MTAEDNLITLIAKQLFEQTEHEKSISVRKDIPGRAVKLVKVPSYKGDPEKMTDGNQHYGCF